MVSQWIGFARLVFDWKFAAARKGYSYHRRVYSVCIKNPCPLCHVCNYKAIFLHGLYYCPIQSASFLTVELSALRQLHKADSAPVLVGTGRNPSTRRILCIVKKRPSTEIVHPAVGYQNRMSASKFPTRCTFSRDCSPNLLATAGSEPVSRTNTAGCSPRALVWWARLGCLPCEVGRKK